MRSNVAAELAAELDGQAVALELPWVDAALRCVAEGWRRPRRDPDSRGSPRRPRRGALDELGYGSTRHRRGGGTGARSTSPATVGRPPALTDARARFPVDGRPPVGRRRARRPRTDRRGCDRPRLTATEARIAELVAAGHRNGDVAAALFVSVATVEAS